MRRLTDYEELDTLCRNITTSFVHLETRDAYGTEVELPYLTKWRRGEPDDHAWLAAWLEMLRGHRTAGRTCRRAEIISEPLSEYQRWVDSFVDLVIKAGEDIRRVARPRLTDVLLPGSGDFYVFDDRLVMFLHYAGNGLNTAFEVTDEPDTVRTCRDAFESVWRLTTPPGDDRPD